MRKPKPTKIITWTSWKAVQREGTVSSAGTAGLQVPCAFGIEKKLITSVAVGGKFKRKCVFASCPHVSKSENGSAFKNWPFFFVKRLSF